MSPRTHQRWSATVPFLVLTATLFAASGCTGGYTLARRDAARLDPLIWFSPVRAADRLALDRWSSAVGPPVVPRSESTQALPITRKLYIVSWNVHLGHGDVARLVGELRAADPNAEVVLLLQEVFRRGPEVPSTLSAASIVAGKLGRDGGRSIREEIETIGQRTGLGVYYVPSMRNGRPSESVEDRGNAILSSLPMSAFDAIELPYERQRRVAVAATISGMSSSGVPWQLRLVSAHLDNLVGPGRGWFAGAVYGRTRQARALLDYLQSEKNVVLGGDFNTWFGFREAAYREIIRAFPDTSVTDRRATFAGLLRLDHLFFRVQDGWQGRFERAADDYGSDHFPLIATVELP